MTSVSMRAPIVAALLACTVPATAQAQVVIDQSEIVPAGGTIAVVSRVGLQVPPSGGPPVYRSGAQTFTAGTDGFLDHIDFQAAWLTPPSDGVYILSLYDGDYVAGTASLVFTDGGLFSSLPGTTAARNGALAMTFDIRGADYAVTVGQRYSVVFDSVPSTAAYGLIIGYGIGTPPAPPMTFGTNYAGGAFYSYTNGVQSPPSALDVGFVSWVDTSSVVPEPAGWGLMLLGFGGAGAAMRRRSRAAAIA